jgi:hypothetical protein
MPVITEELCTAKCAVEVQVACPGALTMAQCVAACLEDATFCTAPGMAYFQCLVANGPDALVCEPSIPAVILRDGFCMQEKADLIACLQLQSPAPNVRYRSTGWISGLASPVTTNQT